MNSSSLKISSRNSICPCGGKTTKKQVSSVLLPIQIGCTPLLLLLWNPLVFRLFFAFGPYFKWILPSFERKGENERRVGCRKNGLCRGVVMKVRDMRSYLLAVEQTRDLQKKCEGLFERETSGRNLVRNADKITENPQGFEGILSLLFLEFT